MSCGPTQQATRNDLPSTLPTVLSDEGFRLFFPLGALYAALWLLIWVFAFSFDLPLASDIPPSLWHAHEMLIGVFGAALIGFLTTAAPEWTDTEPLRGRALWGLAGLWALGRCVGILGSDDLSLLGAVADLAWLCFLLGYLLVLSWRRRTDRLLAFAAWIAALILCLATTHIGFWTGDLALASLALHLAGLSFLGLLGWRLGGSPFRSPISCSIRAKRRPHSGRIPDVSISLPAWS